MKTLLLNIIASAATPWFLSWWFLTCISALLILSVISVIIGQSRRKQNELTIALKEQEQRLYEEKVALLINMSHELRTPLTLIMAPLKRMLAGIGPEHPDYNTLNRIYRQSRRMKDLLNMALDLRKMEVGKSSMKMENSNFNEWLTSVTQDMVTEGKAEGITIIREFDPALTSVDFDKAKCETIMVNILMNAMKQPTIHLSCNRYNPINTKLKRINITEIITTQHFDVGFSHDLQSRLRIIMSLFQHHNVIKTSSQLNHCLRFQIHPGSFWHIIQHQRCFDRGCNR